MKKIGNFFFPDEEKYEAYINEITEKNIWQGERLQFGLSFVKNKNVSLDIGANIGTWSIEMAKHFNKVYAFELYTKTYECLVENTKEYKNIEVFPFGLGDENRKVDIIFDPVIKNTLAGICADLSKEGDYEIKTLDSLNIENVDFIKIDVEGLESKVLKGAKNTILTWKPVIMLEYKERKSKQSGIDVREIDNIIKELNYFKKAGIGSDLVFVHESY